VDEQRWEAIRGRLFGLLVRFDEHLTRRDAALLHEFVEHGEFGLALEQLVDLLAETATPIAPKERDDMLQLNEDMQMGDRVPRVLASCRPA